MKLGLGALKCKFHDIDSINLRAENESLSAGFVFVFRLLNLLLVIITMDVCGSFVT